VQCMLPRSQFSAVADDDVNATKAERSAAMAQCLTLSSNISSFECTLASSVDGGMNRTLLGH